MSDRDTYAEVGTATRAAIAATLGATGAEKAPPSALRCLLAIVHEVASWSRLEDAVTRRRLAALTGMSEREVVKGIRWLQAHTDVVWQHGDSKDGKRWSSRVNLGQTGVPSDHRSGRPPVCETTGTGVLGGSEPVSSQDTLPRSTEEYPSQPQTGVLGDHRSGRPPVDLVLKAERQIRHDNPKWGRDRVERETALTATAMWTTRLEGARRLGAVWALEDEPEHAITSRATREWPDDPSAVRAAVTSWREARTVAAS
jgi:hypothetical protein